MKSIKIKVKTLLLIVLSFVLFAVFMDDLYWGGIKLYNNIVSEENQIELTDLETGTIEYESQRIALLLEEHNYLLYNMITIGEGIVMESARVRLQDAESVLESYKQYNQEENLIEDYPEYILNVVLIQWFAGNVEETLSLMESVDVVNLPDDSKEHYYLIQAAIDLTFYDLVAVEESLSYVVAEDMKPLVNHIKAYIHKIYDYDISYDEINDYKYNEDDSSDYEDYFSFVFYINDNYGRESFSEETNEHATISGHITINGDPLRGALVYMKDWNSMSSSEGYKNNSVVKDIDGSYAIENNYGDKGRIGLKVPWQLVHDKSIELPWDRDLRNDTTVNFEFKDGFKFTKAVIEEGLFVYEINDPSGTSETNYSMVIRHTMPDTFNDQSYFKITGVKGSVPLIDLERDTTMTLGWVSSNDTLAIERLTEHLYLSGDYTFEVNPTYETRETYIKNGIFTEALQTIMTYDGIDEYNEGDLLLADKQLVEAMKWYEKHPSRHNLKVLVALNQYGYIPVEGEFYQKLEGKNLDKAIQFQEQLMELDGFTTQRLNKLVRLSNEAYDYEKEGVLLEEVLSLDPSVYDYFSYGYNLIHRGYYLEGLEVLKENGDMAIDGDRYYSYFLLGNQLEPLTEDIKVAMDQIKGLESYEDFYSLIVSGLYHQAWINLENRKDSDLKMMHQLLFLDRLEFEDLNDKIYIQSLGYDEDDFVSYYRESVEEMQDRHIRSLMKLIKKENNWF